MFAWWLGCAPASSIPLEDVTNRWWHLEVQDLNLFLETDDSQTEGTAWYDWWGPLEPVDANEYGGEWWRADEASFTVDYDGDTWTIRAQPSDEPGCYDLRVGILASDRACPYDP
ncbi:MAG: hypothetical protein ABMA64_13060 [Myxococcota bacterium]